MMRFNNQLPLIGTEGQQKLKEAKVAVVGLGGLGSSALYYLAAAGVGTIGIFDNDRVQLSNLNRQILHDEEDIGKLKVESAKDKIRQFNSEIIINAFPILLTESNCLGYLENYSIIVSCVDNKKTRSLLTKAALNLNIPVVEGGVNRFSGFQLTTKRGYACIGCIWQTETNEKPTEILGVTPAVIGSLEATQTIKIILGNEEGLFGSLITMDLLKMEFNNLKVPRDPNCPICGNFYN